MLPLLPPAWLILCLLAGDAPKPAPEVRVEYLERKAKAAKTAEAQVELAVWCESKGLEQEKQYHLAQAVLRDPKNARAREMLGLKPDAKADAPGPTEPPPAPAPAAPATNPTDAERDTKLVQYEARKVGMTNTAEAHWKLANWCLEKGLEQEARFHLATVVRLEPGRDAAWKKLGFKKVGSRWVTQEQLDAERAEAQAQTQADRKWRPVFDRLQRQLKAPATRPMAEAELAEIEDPRSLPIAAKTFLGGKDPDERSAVTIFGQIECPLSSRYLAQLAVTSNKPATRQSALEILRRRDPRDFVGDWIARFRNPVKYEVKKPEKAGDAGILLIEGGRKNIQRVFQTMAPPNFLVYSSDQISYDQNGLPVVSRYVTTPFVGGFVSQGSTPSANSPQGQAVINKLASNAPAENQEKVKQGLTAISNAASYNPYGPSFNTGGSGLGVTFTTQEVQIPVGQMMLQAEKSKLDAEQRLAAEVASLDRLNEQIRQSNEKILGCLKEITRQDFGTDAVTWGKWWANVGIYQQAGAQAPTPPAGFGPLAPFGPVPPPPTPGGPSAIVPTPAVLAPNAPAPAGPAKDAAKPEAPGPR